MFIKRLDGQCQAKVLAYNPDAPYGVLIQAEWPSGGRFPNRNIVNVSREYFVRKYGQEPV